MTFSIDNQDYEFFMSELNRAHDHASSMAVSSILTDKNDKAKEYAERATKLSAIINDIRHTATMH